MSTQAGEKPSTEVPRAEWPEPASGQEWQVVGTGSRFTLTKHVSQGWESNRLLDVERPWPDDCFIEGAGLRYVGPGPAPTPEAAKPAAEAEHECSIDGETWMTVDFDGRSYPWYRRNGIIIRRPEATPVRPPCAPWCGTATPAPAGGAFTYGEDRRYYCPLHGGETPKLLCHLGPGCPKHHPKVVEPYVPEVDDFDLLPDVAPAGVWPSRGNR